MTDMRAGLPIVGPATPALLGQAPPSPDGKLQKFVPSWPIVVGLIALFMAYRPSQLLNDPDTYLHIAAGRWMFLHRALPTPDPFSFTMAGAHWVAHEWLAELVMAALQGWLGWTGLTLATALCFAFAMTLMTRAVLRHFEPLSGLILVFASFALLEPHLLARAHALALPLMVAWSAEVFAARDSGRSPSLWLLPLMALWANMHGSYMFGLALAGYLGAEAVISPGPGHSRASELRRWSGFLALAVASVFLNANGIDGVLEPFRISAMPTLQATVIEWRSPNFQQFKALELWLLGIIFVSFSTGIKLPITRILLLIGLLYMALQHQRHADPLAVAAPLAIAAPLAPLLNRMTRPDSNSAVAGLFGLPPAKPSTPVIAAALLVVAVFGVVALRHPLERRDNAITPALALAAARQAGVSGPVFNNERFGGYLVLSGVKVFIDGRMEIYGDDFLKRYNALIDGEEPALLNALAQYGIGWTLLAPDDRALLIVDGLPGWRRIYADQYAVVSAKVEDRLPNADDK
jgi:hypothetical protein